jgi:hypothetical protein
MTFFNRRLLFVTLLSVLFVSQGSAAERKRDGVRDRDRIEIGSPNRGPEREHEIRPFFTVLPTVTGDYTVTVTPNPIVIQTGPGLEGRQTFTFTLTSTGGFTGPVTVTFSSSGDVIVLPKNCPSNTFCDPPPATTYTVSLNGSVSDQAIASDTGPNGGTITITTTTPGLPDKQTPVTVPPQPTFSFAVSPGPTVVNIQAGTSQKFTLTTTAAGGFNSPINYSISNTAGDSIDKPNQTVNSPYPAIDFTIAVPSSATPGSSFNININGSGGSASASHTMTVTVTAPAASSDFNVTLSPPSISLTAGGAGTPVTFTAAGTNGFSGTITVTAPTVSGITFSETSFTMTAGQTHAITVTALSSAQAGSTSTNFSAQSGTIGPKLVPLSITTTAAAPAGDFNMTIVPPALTAKVGQPGTSALTITRLNGFTGAVNLTSTSTSPDAQVQFTPSATLAAGEVTRNVVVTAGPNVTTVSNALVTITATAPSLNNKQVSLGLSVTLQPAASQAGAPTLDSITPNGVVRGATPVTVLLSGHNFATTVQALANNPNIIVQSTTILVPGTLAQAVILAKPGVVAGRYAVTLRNNPPSGATTTAVGFFVYDNGDIGAPLGVSAAAILSPLEGKCISTETEIHPHGVIATSGTGTITGHWELENGGAFTRFGNTFTLSVHAGEPTPVDADMPVPHSSAGMHRLRLVIDTPKVMRSAEVQLLMSTIPCASDLTILGPLPDEKARIAGASSPTASADLANGMSTITLRWTLVPGAVGYVVEIEKDGRFFKRAGDCSDEELRAGVQCDRYDSDRGEIALDLVSLTTRDTPAGNAVVSASQMAALRKSKFRWRVKPKYLGDSSDSKWSGWAELPIPQATARRANGRAVQTTAVTKAAINAALPPEMRRDLLLGFNSSAVSDLVGGNDIREIAYQATLADPDANDAVASSDSPTAVRRNPFRRDWLVVPGVTSTYTHNNPQQANFQQYTGTVQTSSTADLGAAPMALKYTTDFSGQNLYGDHLTGKNSRNWTAMFGNAHSTMALRPEAVVGYTSPAFFSESEYLTASFQRAGALARGATRFGTLSYYTTIDSFLSGVVSGFTTRQKVEAAAFELPTTRRFSFKILSLRVRDEAADNTLGDSGRSFGFFSRFYASPLLTLAGEAARSRFQSNDNPTFDRSGNAYRMAANGTKGTFTYRLAASHTDAAYQNPANRGFSANGIPNRSVADLSVTKIVAGGQLQSGVRRTQQTKPGSQTDSTFINLSYSHSIAKTASLSVSGDHTDDQGNADTKTFLQATDRQHMGLTMTLSEYVGRFNFGQTLSHQQTRDHIQVTNRNDTDTLSLNGGGSISTNLSFSTNLSDTASEGVSQFGKNETLSLGLNPTYNIPRFHISLQPHATYTKTRNAVLGSGNTTQDFQATVSWNPVTFHSIGAFQLSSGWNHSQDQSRLGRRPLQLGRTYSATFTLRWGAGIGPATFGRTTA